MKRIVATLVALVLAATPQVALADHIDGETGWYVEYNKSGRMDDNYTQKSWADNVSSLQPGDDITLTVEMRHTNDKAGDWYLTNEVLKSLEEGDAQGSAYGYTLSYEGPSNSRVLYESKTVGGIGSSEGLAEATNAMDDYFFLGTLEKGEKGSVTLNVSLDGETEGNAYFDTLAQLRLKFAVEESSVTPTEKEKKKTEEKVVERTQNTSRTERTVKTTEREEEHVVTQTSNSEDRPADRTSNATDRIEYVTEYVTEEVPATTIVNRIISGSTSGLAKTGDYTTNFYIYAAMVGAGLVLLAVAIRIVRNKNANEKGDVQ